MKTILTVEESQRLIELGVDAKLASMVSWKQTETWARKSVLSNKEHLTLKPFRPAVMGFERFDVKDVFTLADILSILPKEIEDSDDKIFSLNTEWCVRGDFANNHQWAVRYCDGFLVSGDFYAPELIDALYQLLIWLLENGHLKTEKTQ